MSTLRVTTIEAKADGSSPSVNEKVKITNSSGDVMLQLDGATSGITTVGINTTDPAFTVDANRNFEFVGVVTASSFTGNLTGNVTGNVTGGITTSQITVGNSFIKSNQVGVGSTTSSGRDALTGVTAGTLIYNTTVDALQVYNGSEWQTVGDQTTILSASGGNVTDTSSRPGYTSHIFTGPGTLTVSAGADTADILVVGGGGGGGTYISGGGGAGGMRLASTLLSPGTYEVQIGNGGSGTNNPGAPGTSGVPSYIRATSGGVGVSSITGTGGGGGSSANNGGLPGGSGGAGGYADPSPPSVAAPTTGLGNVGGNDPRATPVSEGFPGAWTPEAGPFSGGNGGGGAGESGTYGGGGSGGQPPASDGAGGDGLPVSWAPPSYGTPGPNPGRWFAGGGGGAGGEGTNVRTTGGFGGGGPGGNTIPSRSGGAGGANTGGGGGGGWTTGYPGAGGGSGIVIVSYPSPA